MLTSWLFGTCSKNVMQIQGPWRRKTHGQIYNRIQQPFRDGFNHQGPKHGVSTLLGSRCWLAWIFFCEKKSLGMKGFNRTFLVGFLLHRKMRCRKIWYKYIFPVCMHCMHQMHIYLFFLFVQSTQIDKMESDFIVRSMEQQWMHLWSVQLAWKGRILSRTHQKTIPFSIYIYI